MKFLIFNIIVSFSLGYLLFSKPNENFNEWIGNAKTKVSEITKKEIISSLKKATNNKINKPNINNVILEQKNEEDNLKVSNNDNETAINKNNIDVKKPTNEQQNIRELIKQVLMDKKINQLTKDNSKLYKDKHIKKIKEIKEIKKIEITSKFMTFEQRQNALAELITDMEIYHLNGLKH
tara:strand:+ start:89 stop:625 length:537 start_codon:yes stop_codon:yes gene_type:complete